VDVYIQLARKDRVLIIPRRAVELADGVPLVRVRTAAGTTSQQVSLGAQDGFNVEITDGLKEGDVVVY
jgi:hypothetical protein